ncbi:tyrosine-protein phosphatase non-receptor type 61F isoform X1 [Chironomus tepperi]|uniref:tyrosine-protein phosphatase non-receptor type 61F isoform X1 n=1 Tax=Chironomus tepperi TaxID=113505 RepID=UPI00391F6CF6
MEEKSSIYQEYTQINEKNQWFIVYQNIKDASEAEATKCNYSIDESKKSNNRKLNRYRDVNPYDHSRIILKRQTIDSDYINANLVKLERAKRQYILCQGPLEHTVGHFWLMVWEQQSKAILMLNKIIEKKQVKCHLYWPKKEGQRLNLPDVGLTVEFVTAENYKNFSKRLFRVTDVESTKSREVIQFHYTQWPDFGVPSSPIAFLQFLKQVRDSGVLDENVGPPVIHCSAGIGRSGTFCLVDCCLVLIDKEGENRVSVQDILLELRKYRMGLIQTYDQLTFSYEAIIEGMRRMNNDTFNDLDNLEIATGSDDEIEQSPPPIPPRSSSFVPRISPPESEPRQPITISDSSESTSSDASEIREDTSSDSDDTAEDDKINNHCKSKDFDANSSLPPIPNGTLDLTSPDKQQKFSSDEEKSPLLSDNNVTPNNINNSDLRHRTRVARNEAMQDKIREIKRKQKETESKKISLPKKRRSLLILSGVILVLSVFAYVYVKS